uniref:Dihydroflavonol 4-reductase n=1 Tax=Daucus carota subsp. sativus TaxID=79200 RepID=A0A162A2Q7_DAUCS
MGGERTVCVTGASGYIGSFLVKRLLERRYHVRATVRDPGNQKKVKHLLELANASTHLSLWKAELAEEGGYDDAIQGCQGRRDRFNNIEWNTEHYEIMLQGQNCEEMYVVAKTIAEKAAWKYAEENGIDMVTVHPSFVLGRPFITPYTNISIDAAISLYTKDEAGIASLKKLNGFSAVHVDDVCNAHIYLFEHPLAREDTFAPLMLLTYLKLRIHLASSTQTGIYELSTYKEISSFFSERFEGLDEAQTIIPCSSKKLRDLGFEFAQQQRY